MATVVLAASQHGLLLQNVTGYFSTVEEVTLVDFKEIHKTLALCYTYRFSTAPVVTLTRLIVTLYVHCLFSPFSFHVYSQYVWWHSIQLFKYIRTKLCSSYVSLDSYINFVRAIHFVELTVLPSNRYHLFQVIPSCFRWYRPVSNSNYQDSWIYSCNVGKYWLIFFLTTQITEKHSFPRPI